MLYHITVVLQNNRPPSNVYPPPIFGAFFCVHVGDNKYALIIERPPGSHTAHVKEDSIEISEVQCMTLYRNTQTHMT